MTHDVVSSSLSFLNKYSFHKGRAPAVSFEVVFVLCRAVVLFQRSQPAGSRPFWLEFTVSLLDNTTYLFVSPPRPGPAPPSTPLSPRAIATPAHPPGRTTSKCLRRGRRRRGVCLQSVQRRPAPHPVDQTRGEEWQ